MLCGEFFELVHEGFLWNASFLFTVSPFKNSPSEVFCKKGSVVINFLHNSHENTKTWDQGPLSEPNKGVHSMNLLAKYPLTEDLEFQKNLSSNFKIWVLRFKKINQNGSLNLISE